MTRNPAQSKRDFLSAVLAWADGSALSVAALPVSEPGLLADFRSLGFDDAGILPAFAAPTRPGALRRALAAILPAAPPAPGVEIVSEVLPVSAREAVRAGLAASFDALADESADSEAPLSGAWLRRDGHPVAYACWRTPAPGTPVRVEDWLAPPAEPAVTAALARAALAAAASGNAPELVFSTPHRRLGLHLRLARFLPRTGASRLLVRFPGARPERTPDPAGWHLTSATRIEPARPAGAAIISGSTSRGAAIV